MYTLTGKVVATNRLTNINTMISTYALSVPDDDILRDDDSPIEGDVVIGNTDTDEEEKVDDGADSLEE